MYKRQLQFRARITGVAYAGTGRKKRFTAYVQDPTGSAELVWFQGIKWIEKRCLLYTSRCV